MASRTALITGVTGQDGAHRPEPLLANGGQSRGVKGRSSRSGATGVGRVLGAIGRSNAAKRAASGRHR